MHSLRKGEKCEPFSYVDSGLTGIFPKYGVTVFIAEPDFENDVNKGAAVVTFSKNAVAITIQAAILTIARNCADALTKPLDPVPFERLLQNLVGQR